MPKIVLALTAVVTTVTLGCASSEKTYERQESVVGESVSRKSPVTMVIETPATYTGIIPCADCAGIRLTLSLRSDGVFLLRQTYLGANGGQDDSFVDLGLWSLGEDGRTVILRGNTDAPRQFAVKNTHTLRMLNTLGEEITSQLNYDLVCAEQFDPIADRFRIRGMYTSGADAGFLTECLTGKRFPVAREGDHTALAAAYRQSRRSPEASLLVTFEGHLTTRPRMEGNGEEEVVVVERFDRLWPAEACAMAQSTVVLENTYWKLIELNGKTVVVDPAQREPHLRFVPPDGRLQGFAGCNVLLGSYTLEGDNLRFTQMATTRKACPPPYMEQENAFLKALELTTTYKVFGEALELYSEDTLLVRLQAVSFK